MIIEGDSQVLDSTNQQQFAYCFCPLIVCLLMMYDLALDFFLNYVTLI